MTHPQFPCLTQLLGAYFHQDWVAEFDHYEDVLTTIRQSTDATCRQTAVQEIETLLAVNRTENDWQTILQQIGCEFNPASAGLNTQQWLELVQTCLG